MASAPPDPDVVKRKLDAKRANERIKSIYAFANTLGAAIITVAAITPAVNNGIGQLRLDAASLFFFGVSLHAFGQVVIEAFWESEE